MNQFQETFQTQGLLTIRSIAFDFIYSLKKIILPSISIESHKILDADTDFTDLVFLITYTSSLHSIFILSTNNKQNIN